MSWIEYDGTQINKDLLQEHEKYIRERQLESVEKEKQVKQKESEIILLGDKLKGLLNMITDLFENE